MSVSTRPTSTPVIWTPRGASSRRTGSFGDPIGECGCHGRVLPDRWTHFPLAYQARKHRECLEKMKERQKKSYAYRVPVAVALW